MRHMTRVLGHVPEVPYAAREVFAAYGRYWAEVFWVRPRRLLRMLERVDVSEIGNALEVRDRGEGMIFALPHMGNWELAGAVARQHGIEVVAVAEALRNRRIAEWFVSLRRQLGIEVLLTDSRARLTKKLVEALDRGAAVALLADRDLSGRGVGVDFFEERTTLPAGPAALALRAGVVLLPVASYFSDHGHRLVVLDPVPHPSGGTESERVAALTQSLAEQFEELIRRAPTDWHLVQPNWPSDR